jgi:hypothetical protein
MERAGTRKSLPIRIRTASVDMGEAGVAADPAFKQTPVTKTAGGRADLAGRGREAHIDSHVCQMP